MNQKNIPITIPEGMMENAKGAYLPISKIEDIDLARDDVVIDVVQKALALQSHIRIEKKKMHQELEAFIQLSLETYGVKQGGKKGNITLLSFNGRYKIQIAQQDSISFDERLQGAKELIDECVIEWSASSNDNIKALVEHAFQVDKQGKINTSRVLGLLKLKITDDKWQQAMRAIIDSRHTTASKEYIRFYQRNHQGKYDAIPLEFAGL